MQNEKRLKILFLADAGNIHTQRWVKYFANRGDEVHLISFRTFGGNNIENVKLHLLKVVKPRIRVISYLLGLIFNITQIRRLIRKLKPGIIHAHYVNGYGFWGALSGFHPFVVTAWGSDVLIAPRKSKIARWTVKYALKRADLITCDAEHIKETLIELGAEPEKISLINFGTDTQKFSPRQGSAKTRQELEIFDSPTVLSLRWLEPLYDIETLIASIPLVLKEIPEVKFLLLGKGSQEVKLKELAKSLGVAANIRFVGQIPNDELPQYLTSVDIYVSTSLSDGGLAACTAEAMACGLPVITTDFGDNRKWVQDGVNGYIIPLRSPQVLASKIIHLIHNKDIRGKFGQINRQIIERRNNWKREMGKMEKLYEELLARCKR